MLGYLPGDERKAAVREMSRVIRLGGQLILGVWTDIAASGNGVDRSPVREGDAQGPEALLHFFGEDEISELITFGLLEDALFLERSGEFGGEYVAYSYRVGAGTPLSNSVSYGSIYLFLRDKSR